MKKFLNWTLLILAATAAITAGVYCLVKHFDSKEMPSDQEAMSNKNKPAIPKTQHRHYTKLTLS